MLSVNVQFRSLLLCAILEQTCTWGHTGSGFGDVASYIVFFVMIYPNLEKFGDNLGTDFFSPALLQTADRNTA